MNKMNENNNVLVVHVAELWHVLLRRVWLLVLCAAVFAGAGYFYASSQQGIAMYTTTTKMYVTGVDSAGVSTANFQLGQQVINNYIEIMESRPVLEQVIENLGLNMEYWEMRGCISTHVPDNTCMLEVSVTFTEPEWAKKVADELIVDASAYALEIMGCTPPTVYEPAYVPKNANAVYSSVLKYTAFGGIGGFGLAGILILLFYFGNTKFTTPDKVWDCLKLRTLALVPTAKSPYVQKAYQGFLSRLYFEKTDAKTISFVSVDASEDKNTYLCHQAESLAELGKKVLILENFMEEKSWSLDGSCACGLLQYLTENKGLDEVRKKTKAYDAIYCGGNAANAGELLCGDKYKDLLEQLKKEYDVILMNNAPAIYNESAVWNGLSADANVLVLSGKHSRTYDAKDVLSSMLEKGVTFNGAVLVNLNTNRNKNYFMKRFGQYFGVYKR